MKKTGLFLIVMIALIALVAISCEPAWKKTVDTIKAKMEVLDKASDKVAAGDQAAIDAAKPQIKEINDIIKTIDVKDADAKAALDEVRKQFPNADTLLSAESLDDFKIIKDAKDVLVRIDPQIQEFIAVYTQYEAAPTNRELGLKVKNLSTPLMAEYKKFEDLKSKLSDSSKAKYDALKTDLFNKYPKLNDAMLKLKGK
jgi:hypothetical protein